MPEMTPKLKTVTKSILSDGPSAKEQYEAMVARVAARKSDREADQEAMRLRNQQYQDTRALLDGPQGAEYAAPIAKKG